jgi:glutamyl/glutaminyl-tRNA synthetase
MEVLLLAKDRLKTLADLPQVTDFLFTAPKQNIALIHEHKQLSKIANADLSALLQTVRDEFTTKESFTSESIQETLNNLLATTNEKPVTLFSIIRIATTWAPFSPDLAPSLALLGKDEVLSRLNAAIELLDSN